MELQLTEGTLEFPDDIFWFPEGGLQLCEGDRSWNRRASGGCEEGGMSSLSEFRIRALH